MNDTKFISIANSALKNKITPKYAYQKCDDDIVGYITGNDISKYELWFEIEKRGKHISEIDISNCTNKTFDKTIVIVLESPHIDEYSYQYEDNNKKKSDFIHPALGKTGINLQLYFPAICNWVLSTHYPKDKNKTWRIILMNSIQYQCSLGVNTLKYRDHMWLKLWFDNKCSEDFKKRIKEYNPDVIFNFCTEGENLSGKLNIDYVSQIKLSKESQEILNENIIKLRAKRKTKKEFTIRECITYSLIEDKPSNVKHIFEGTHPSSWHRAKKNRYFSSICCKHGLITNLKYSFDDSDVKRK